MCHGSTGESKEESTRVSQLLNRRCQKLSFRSGAETPARRLAILRMLREAGEVSS